jgi:hypothetical protein
MKRPFVVVREICKKADQVVEEKGDDARENADERREEGNPSDAKTRGRTEMLASGW